MTTTPEPRKVRLRGFTPSTLDYLAEALGVKPNLSEMTALEDGITGKRAIGLLAWLREVPDDLFPGGKWATIQHLEALIAQAIDEPEVGHHA